MADAPLIQRLARAILVRGRCDRYQIGRTKLVKMLYLLDCEYYRYVGRTLTGADWIFHHYGPYARDLVEAVEATPGIRFFQRPLPDGERDFIDYAVEDDGSGATRFPLEIQGLLDRVFEDWAGADLAGLLDHVYFETPPMLDARRGDRLDFSRIPRAGAAPPEPVDPYRLLDAETRERLRRGWEEAKTRRARKVRVPFVPDAEYLGASAAMDAAERRPSPEAEVRMAPGDEEAFSKARTG